MDEFHVVFSEAKGLLSRHMKDHHAKVLLEGHGLVIVKPYLKDEIEKLVKEGNKQKITAIISHSN